MPKRFWLPGTLLLAALLSLAAACVRNSPEVIVITATFEAAQNTGQPVPAATFAVPTLPPGAPPIVPTLDATRVVSAAGASDYVVQPGDTLSGIAASVGVSVETLIQLNSLANPDVLEVGQALRLPGAPNQTTPDSKILPDARLVYGPGANRFDIAGFISAQPGYIRTALDEVRGEFLTAAQVIERVAHEYSVDPRILLALLELRGGWLTNPTPSDVQILFPMGVVDTPLGINRSGLYRQLAWAADQLNRGYYGWKGRALSTLELNDGTRYTYHPGLNAGTVAVQYLLSQYNTAASWQAQVAPDGLYTLYFAYFGDPFAGVVEPLVPPGIEQPPLTLPFSIGQTWFYTGGPHGGWGAGSAWAAVDFAPPDELPPGSSGCYVSDFFATAVAPGIVARTAEGTIILDLDGDGDETTGWTILYLHLAEQDRVTAGTTLNVNDPVGRPSCEGGYSNGTHMHIARRYNGEWIPAACEACAAGQERPPFVLDGWMVVGLPGQEYQGYLIRAAEQRVADQGRLTLDNRIAR